MNIFFTSDTHFGHANILTFRDTAGSVIRPFSSVEEMDEMIIERWNEVVRAGDRVYHLGDVSFDRRGLPQIMARLRGSKRLMLGNHDDIKRFDLVGYFKKIQLWRIFKEHDFTCTHIPLADGHLRTTFNVHGHIHHLQAPTERHLCVCVEQRNYAPVHLDTILAEIRDAA